MLRVICSLYRRFCFFFWCGRLRPWTAGSILLLSRCFRPMSVLRLDLDEAQLILFLGVIASLCYMCTCAYKCVNSYFYVRVSWVRKYWTCYLTNYLRECYFRWVCVRTYRSKWVSCMHCLYVGLECILYTNRVLLWSDKKFVSTWWSRS